MHVSMHGGVHVSIRQRHPHCPHTLEARTRHDSFLNVTHQDVSAGSSTVLSFRSIACMPCVRVREAGCTWRQRGGKIGQHMAESRLGQRRLGKEAPAYPHIKTHKDSHALAKNKRHGRKHRHSATSDKNRQWYAQTNEVSAETEKKT